MPKKVESTQYLHTLCATDQKTEFFNLRKKENITYSSTANQLTLSMQLVKLKFNAKTQLWVFNVEKKEKSLPIVIPTTKFTIPPAHLCLLEVWRLKGYKKLL